MGQDCPSVLLYMMHSNNNNIYIYMYIYIYMCVYITYISSDMQPLLEAMNGVGEDFSTKGNGDRTALIIIPTCM